MSKRIITGIDIRCNSILAITVAKKNDIYQIQMIQNILLKDNIEVKNIDCHQQVIVDALKQIKQNLPKFSSHIALSLAESEVIAKEIVLSATEHGSYIEAALYQKFAKVVPLPIEELVVDYISNENVYQVFATRKESVVARQHIAQASGLKLGLVDLEKQAYLQCLVYLQESYLQKSYGNVILVDIGTCYLRFGALIKGEPYFRTLDIFPESARDESSLADFVMNEWQRFLPLNLDYVPDVIFIYQAPAYEAALFQLLSDAICEPCLRVDLSQAFTLMEGLYFTVDEPFIALGNALRAFEALGNQKYAA